MSEVVAGPRSGIIGLRGRLALELVLSTGFAVVFFRLWPTNVITDDGGIALRYMDNFARGYFFSYNPSDGPVYGLSSRQIGQNSSPAGTTLRIRGAQLTLLGPGASERVTCLQMGLVNNQEEVRVVATVHGESDMVLIQSHMRLKARTDLLENPRIEPDLSDIRLTEEWIITIPGDEPVGSVTLASLAHATGVPEPVEIIDPAWCVAAPSANGAGNGP